MRKFKFLVFALISVLFLTACVWNKPVTTISTDSTTVNQQPTTDELSITSGSVSSEATTATTTSTTNPVTYTTAVSTDQFQVIELFALNDFHGGAYTDVSMIADIGEYLKYKKTSTDHTIIIASGDIFQGSALSNYYYGRPLVEAMNVIGFDAFTLGNHEFDWGIETIGAYHDGNAENGEALYPALAANIVSKSTGEMLPWTEPYTIIDVNGVKVGIIGVIGDIMESIAASRVEDIEFLDAADTVYEYAEVLRVEEACDIVVVSLHEYDYYVNYEIAQFTGNHKVDALFNGHTHTSLDNKYVERDGIDMPYAQASNYSYSLFTKITLIYDRARNEVSAFQAEVIGEDQLNGTDNNIRDILDTYGSQTDYVDFVGEELAQSIGDYYRDELAPWGASVIRDYLGLDFGMVNAGGFRVAMESGQVLMGDLIVIYPFDNYIKTNKMTGGQLTELYVNHVYSPDYDDDVVFDDAVTYDSYTGTLYKDGIPVDPDTWYTVGAVDYIFDKNKYSFLDGIDIVTTSFLMRDLLAEDLRNHTGPFDPADGSSYTLQAPVAYNYDFSELKKQIFMI